MNSVLNLQSVDQTVVDPAGIVINSLLSWGCDPREVVR
jgi:hypothetical protein